MRRLILIFAIVITASSVLPGQEVDKPNLEELTFSLYKQQNWKELIHYGKQALDQGMDYYYMRMRLGIAFYERHNYQRALIHFKKAAEFNDRDPYLVEYMYFSNRFLGRELEALDVSRKFPAKKIKKYITPRLEKLKIGSLGFGYAFPNIDAGSSLVGSIDNTYDGYQTVVNRAFNMHIGFNNLASQRLKLYYHYGLRAENRYTFYRDALTDYYIPEQKLFEHHLYLRGDIYLGKGFEIAGAFKLLPGVIPAVYYGGSGRMGGYTSYIPAYKYTDFSTNLALSWNIPYFDISAIASYSGIGQDKFLQEGVSLTYFPLGNLNLYLTGGWYRKQEIYQQQLYYAGTHYEYKAGIKLFHPVWLELGGYTGDLASAVSNMGLYVFNSSNPSNYIYSASLLISLKDDKALLSLNYNYRNAVSSFYPSDNTLATSNTVKYNIYSINATVSWNF